MSLNFTKLPYVDGETVIPASNLNAIQDAILDLDSNKVEKEQGKGLSTNDYSDEDKTKVNTALQPSVLENYRTAALQDVIDEAQDDEVNDLKSAKAPVIIDTASGAVASFDDGADGMPVKKLVANIEPVQDLHGYDHPWPAGSTKNLLQPTPYGGLYAQAAGVDLKNVGITMEYSFSSDQSTVNVDVVTAWRGRIFATPPLDAGTYSTFEWKIGYGDRVSVYVTDGELVVESNPYNNSEAGTQTARQITVSQGQRIAVFVGKTRAGTASIINFMIWAGTGGMTYIPFENFCPISGYDSATIYHSGADTSDPDVISVSWEDEAGTVYGGTVTLNPDKSADVVSTMGNIASYDGETLPGTWISSMDVYAEGATPTTGAQVVYELAEPVSYHFDDVGQLKTFLGTNNIWCDTGDTEVNYPADTKLYIDNKITQAIANALNS